MATRPEDVGDPPEVADAPFDLSSCDRTALETSSDAAKATPCPGSDSGVEVAHGEALSCASSVVSCASGCDDSFGAGRPPPHEGTTSEGGSESSSIGGGSASTRRPPSSARRRVAVPAKPSPAPKPAPPGRAPSLATGERARSRDKSAPGRDAPLGPKPAVPPRNSLALLCRDSPSVRVKPTKTSAARCRTPGHADRHQQTTTTTQLESKAAFDKYATLPRRKRDASPDSASPKVHEGSAVRRLPPYPAGGGSRSARFASKIRIYHETGAQTALLGDDVEKALAGVGISEIRTDLATVKKAHKGVQADGRNREIERLEAKARALADANAKLQAHCDEQASKVAALEARLEEERGEKAAAQEELQRNTQRVLSMLGGGGESGAGGDSLVLLESQLQTSANIVVKQQEEMSKLHASYRDVQQELNKSVKAYRALEAHLEESELETTELQEFLQAEKSTLQEALRESEENNLKLQREVARSRRECRLLVRISEQRRHEILAARARLATHRPPQATPVALPTLAQRLQSLLHALIQNYSISPEDLEDVIYNNEAFCNSVSSEAYSPGSPMAARPQLPSSLPTNFLPSRFSDDDNSADLLDSETEPCLMLENALDDVQNPDSNYPHAFASSSAISIMSCPNVAAGNNLNDVDHRRLHRVNKEDSFSSLNNITAFSGDDLSPAAHDDKPASESSYYRPDVDTFDLLNMGYSEHDSLQNLSQAILQRQQSEAECSVSEDHRDYGGVVDQVAALDNLVARLLKILKIIHTKNCGHVRTPKDKLNHIFEEAQVINVDKGDSATEANKKIENGTFDTQADKNAKTCAKKNHVNSQMCGVEEQTSPRHSAPNLTDCGVNSPQPIDSAA